MIDLTRDKKIEGVGTKQKNYKRVVHVSPLKLGIFISTTRNRMGASCSGTVFKISNIDGETCTSKQVLFSSVLYRLLIPLCTVSSGTSQSSVESNHCPRLYKNNLMVDVIER